MSTPPPPPSSGDLDDASGPALEPRSDAEDAAADAARMLAELREGAELAMGHEGQLRALLEELEGNGGQTVRDLSSAVRRFVGIVREQVAFAVKQSATHLERMAAMVAKLEATVEPPPLWTPPASPGETAAARLAAGGLRCSGCGKEPDRSERARIATDRLRLGIPGDQVAFWTCDLCRACRAMREAPKLGPVAFLRGPGMPISELAAKAPMVIAEAERLANGSHPGDMTDARLEELARRGFRCDCRASEGSVHALDCELTRASLRLDEEREKCAAIDPPTIKRPPRR